MLRVSSFNIKNDYNKYNVSKTNEIYNYLVNNNIDILCLQEVYSKVDKDLKKILDNKYSYYGNYRFYIKFLFNIINEKNPIISSYPILFHKTYHMPHLPSLLKRIVTLNVIEYKNYKISIYNTHLDYKYEKVKLRQLNYLYRLIAKDNNLIILMGDFNLKNNKDIFNKFCSLLEKKGINRVEFNDRTFKESRCHREIDHIFISNKFFLVNHKIIKDLKISDHYPILVDIDF